MSGINAQIVDPDGYVTHFVIYTDGKFVRFRSGSRVDFAEIRGAGALRHWREIWRVIEKYDIDTIIIDTN